MSQMEPERPRRSLADEPWFIEFLAGKGFEKTSPTTFSRGGASVSVEGTTVAVHPGNGEKVWRTNFHEAERASVRSVLEQILKMRPFLTESDLALERIETQRLERALTGIANTIKEGPDTGTGIQLRRFLWSLYNGHHLVNLWRMTCVLDATRGGWVSEVCTGAFVGTLKEDDIKRALLVAGEMQRWDLVTASPEQHGQIEDALRGVEDVLRTLPPGNSHTHLKKAHEALLEAREALRRAKDAPEESGQ